MADNFILSGHGTLVTGDAAAAVLVQDDGKYVLQLRSALPDIWYPDHWGLFGGGVEPGEDAAAALRRELREELEFEPWRFEEFVSFDFDLTMLGRGKYYRRYYIVSVRSTEFDQFRLHEGMAVKAFAPAEIFGGLRVTPYDAFALWLHFARARFAASDSRR